MAFLYVKVPIGGAASVPDTKLHLAIQDALARDGLGSVVGWGTSLDDRRHEPAFHRVDIEVTRLAEAIPLLQRTLAALPVPGGTEIHYTEQGAALQVTLGAAGWGSPERSVGAWPPRA